MYRMYQAHPIQLLQDNQRHRDNVREGRLRIVINNRRVSRLVDLILAC
jgi:hypothetical protein